MHKLPQRIKLRFQEIQEGALGSELVLWSIEVFDRAAVIAPQRPERVSIVKLGTFERDSLP